MEETEKALQQIVDIRSQISLIDNSSNICFQEKYRLSEDLDKAKLRLRQLDRTTSK